jgi:hypothetical protein
MILIGPNKPAKSQSADVGRSRFHLAMLLRVRTHQLNFSGAYLRPMRNVDPGIATQLNGIDRIRNHSSTQAKVVLGNRISNTILRVVERLVHRLGVADGLFNRVNAHLYCTELASQLSGNGRFSSIR